MSERDKAKLPAPLGDALESGLTRAREERLWANIRSRRAMGGHSEPPKAGLYLPAPLSRVLVEGDDLTAERSRLWREIRARTRTPKQTRSLHWPGFALGTLVAATAALLIGFWPALFRRDRTAATAAAPAGVLLRSDGTPMQAVEASASSHLVKLADHSEIRLAPGARVEPLLSSGNRFELLLARGSAEFSVTPSGPRHWVVEAGVARIEVVGTVFRVTREADRLRVSVSRGVVLVRGEAVPGWVQRLTAGHSIEVAKPITQVGLPITVPIVVPQAPAAPERIELPEFSVTRAPTGARRSEPHTSWKKDLEKGQYAAAYEALGSLGLTREIAKASSAETLLALADVARLSGHPGDAVLPLERVLRDFHDSPQVAMAAFTLGRVQLDQLGAAGPAAAAFEQTISLHPPHALLADCHARLVEAYARAGDIENAKRAAARYRTLFPAGRNIGDLERWTNP